jgi:hypothetical protein
MICESDGHSVLLVALQPLPLCVSAIHRLRGLDPGREFRQMERNEAKG